MVKRGFFFWIEMIFLIIIITIAILSLPKSRDNFLAAKDATDLEKLGLTALENLDQARVLENFTNATNFANSNFSALSIYIKKSLPTTVETRIEYFNGTVCRNETGFVVSGCGNFTKSPDTMVADYTFARLNQPISIHLYLRRLFS